MSQMFKKTFKDSNKNGVECNYDVEALATQINPLYYDKIMYIKYMGLKKN
jgi:hypothetical protein